MPLIVLAAAATVLLAQAAVGKLRRPAPTARALLALADAVGRRPRPLHALRAARILAVAELTVVAAALAAPAAVGESLLAATYAGFTLVVAQQLRTVKGSDPASCGCFGTDVPLGPGHAVLNAACFAAAAVTALDRGARPLAAALAPGDLRHATLLGLSVLVAGLGWAVFAVLPLQRDRVSASAGLRAA